jgi:hypothetical protein
MALGGKVQEVFQALSQQLEVGCLAVAQLCEFAFDDL